jgi:uncharacterized membrane protein
MKETLSNRTLQKVVNVIAILAIAFQVGQIYKQITEQDIKIKEVARVIEYLQERMRDKDWQISILEKRMEQLNSRERERNNDRTDSEQTKLGQAYSSPQVRMKTKK